MTAERLGQATSEDWMFPPEDGWTYDQVKDLELPFDWELVDGVIAPKPDVVVFDKRDLNYFELECVPVAKVTLVVEVVSPGSRQDDRVRKPALFAAAKVPYFWRVERERDNAIAVHEYWLHHETRSYIPAPEHPVHRDKLITRVPFPVEIDLTSLTDF